MCPFTCARSRAGTFWRHPAARAAVGRGQACRSAAPSRVPARSGEPPPGVPTHGARPCVGRNRGEGISEPAPLRLTAGTGSRARGRLGPRRVAPPAARRTPRDSGFPSPPERKQGHGAPGPTCRPHPRATERLGHLGATAAAEPPAMLAARTAVVWAVTVWAGRPGRGRRPGQWAYDQWPALPGSTAVTLVGLTAVKPLVKHVAWFDSGQATGQTRCLV